MNKKLISFFLVLFSVFQSFTQVQWANEVVEFSSQNTGLAKQQCKASQVLGKPNKLPAVGTSLVAWVPEMDDKGIEFITVSFKKAQKIQQVAVAESFNPGSIVKITGFDSLGTAYVLYTNENPKAIDGVTGRMFNCYFELTAKPIKKIRLDINTATVPGSNQIDAIGISPTKTPIEAKINLLNVNEEIAPKENLGTNVNSATDDLCPVITPDGKKLYYTRQNHPDNIAPIGNQDVWMSELLENNTFSLAKNIGEPINNTDNSSICSITPDGQQALVLNVYKPDGTMEKGASIAKFNGISWDKPVKVEIDSFYNDNIYGEYNLSNSGQQLIMTLERKDAIGGKDIYVSFLKEDGTFTAPLHMGKQINTAASETSPFLSSDMKTMYFSSAGFSGYGKNDMYVTRRLDETWTNWSEPENLGDKINTPDWDAYFSVPANGEYAYYVSYSNSLGASDIFRQKLPAVARPTPLALVSGRVFHSKTKAPLRTKITYKNLSTGKILGTAYSDSLSGGFKVSLPAGFKYAIYAEKDNFYAVNEAIDLTKLDKFTEKVIEIPMVPIEVGEMVRLNNLFFDFNKATLKQESFVELEQLVKLMQAKPNLKIEIDGHTDDVGEDAYNLTLSLNRAKSVYSYLISKGIAANRLTFKGFGEKAPIVKGTDEKTRQLNRRVEFKILAK